MKTRHLSLILAIIFLSIAFQEKCCFGAQFWDINCDSLENMSENYLRNRWTLSQVGLLLECVKQGCEFDSLPFIKRYPNECDVFEGFDLRGIRFPQPYLLEGYKLQLSFVHLEKSILFTQSFKEASLFCAHFEESDLVSSDFSGAQCHDANFKRVTAVSAKFIGAILFKCDFHGANLGDADFTEADLLSADFSGASLVGTSFSQAELTSARFKNTFLDNARLQQANCRYIEWVGYFVGEERDADLMRDALREDASHLVASKYKDGFEQLFGYSRDVLPIVSEEIMIQYYERAKFIYRYLKNIYRNYDFHETAKEFHFRENCVATKLSSKPFVWLARKLLFEWTYGYGSRPWRLFWSSAIAVLLFAMGYVVLSILPIKSGIYRSDKRNKSPVRITTKCLSDLPSVFVNILHFSLLTFVTFGYGTITPQQWVRMLRLEEIDLKAVRWARIVSALESLVGIYLLALFATVVFGK